MANKEYYPDRNPGERNCLKCGKKFKSYDVTANRICSVCAESNSKERTTKVFKCHGDGDT
jgi:DnaJ-class molecular chaperone